MINKYKLKISGKNTRYFLDELIKRKINIYEINKSKNELIIIIDENQFNEVLEIRTSLKIDVIDRFGISKYKYFIKNNYIFILFFCLSIFYNIFLGNIIFDIDVVHSNKEIRNIIYNDLKYYGISKYNFKVSYEEKEKIKNKILMKERDLLEWIEIEEIGTKYVVNVERRKKNSKKDKCENRNIIARKDARILEISAESGEIVKKINDYVRKGDILISGVIHNKEDIVSNKCAIGNVYGEVWYKVNISLPKYYREEKCTGGKNYGMVISFFDKNINLFNKFNNMKVKNIINLNNFFIPINISIVSYEEVKVTSKNFTYRNVDNDALEIAESKIKKYLKNKENVISKKVLKKDGKKSKIDVEVFVKVKEDITSYKVIEEKEVEE